MTNFKKSADCVEPLITILGPTASGKTSLGVALANKFNGEIISADSRQVYRGMDIGTGKDLEEYEETPYHLIDIAQPGDEYNIFEFVTDFNAAIEKVHQSNRIAFLVGGTGMYLDAILNRYQLVKSDSIEALRDLSNEQLKEQLLERRPNQHNTTDLVDRNRLIKALEIAISEDQGKPAIVARATTPLTLGLQFPREISRQRITQRLKQRLKQGMLEEVEQLNQQGVPWEALEFYGLEYRFIAQHLRGKLSYNDMYQKLNSAIHQFAKQQEKWFRNIEKKGHIIHWLDTNLNPEEQAIDLISGFLDAINS